VRLALDLEVDELAEEDVVEDDPPAFAVAVLEVPALLPPPLPLVAVLVLLADDGDGELFTIVKVEE